MKTVEPIEAPALADRTRLYARNPASGIVLAQSRRVVALADIIATLEWIAPSAVAVAWDEACSAVTAEDVAQSPVRSGLATTAEHATLRELVAAVCEGAFACAVIDAAGAQ